MNIFSLSRGKLNIQKEKQLENYLWKRFARQKGSTIFNTKNVLDLFNLCITYLLCVFKYEQLVAS